MKQAKVLTDAELKRVLAVCAQQQHAARNRLLVLLSHYAGLRVSEIASLRWNDVLGPDGKFRKLFHLQAKNTKANEARAVHSNDKLLKELKQYRSAHGEPRSLDDPLIPSQVSRTGFSADSLGQTFGRIYAAAGIVGASSHSGRRWFITKLAHSGVSPKVIMELAGHKQLTTTQRYIEVNDELLRRAVEVL
ncbi:MAG: site-specific integrase [Rhizobiaceae bacterium]|jgi:integrase/recombinase XerD